MRLVEVGDDEATPASVLVELEEDLLDGGVAGERAVSGGDDLKSRGGTHQVIRTPSDAHVVR